MEEAKKRRINYSLVNKKLDFTSSIPLSVPLIMLTFPFMINIVGFKLSILIIGVLIYLAFKAHSQGYTYIQYLSDIGHYYTVKETYAPGFEIDDEII